jgi:hypothetical protein
VPERHHREVRRFRGDLRCESWGCPEQVSFEAVYVFQHEGKAQATRRVKRLCHRHAQGWAEAYRVDWTFGEATYTAPRDPLTRDTYLEAMTPGQPRPRLWRHRGRPCWWRNRFFADH